MSGEEIAVRIADILLVVADVGAGDYAARLTNDLSEQDALYSLYQGLNRMIGSLDAARARSDAYGRDLEEKLATIETQRNAIAELSTPILEVWQGVLCLPVVGVLDSGRSAEMAEVLLNAVVERKASRVIIDITGIQVIDTAAADHFLRMAHAVRLLGSRCVLTGINPAIAQTLVHMGIDLAEIETYRSLRSALRAHLGSQR